MARPEGSIARSAPSICAKWKKPVASARGEAAWRPPSPCIADAATVPAINVVATIPIRTDWMLIVRLAATSCGSGDYRTTRTNGFGGVTSLSLWWSKIIQFEAVAVS